MKAVDILVAARNRLTKYENWTTGSMASVRFSADDGQCFCSIGAVLKESGGMADGLVPVPNKLFSELYCNPEVPVEKQKAVSRFSSYCMNSVHTQEALNAIAIIKEEIAASGFKAYSAIKALQYLHAASKIVANNPSYNIVSLNDYIRSRENHARVLAMFDLAIKNAKRRHENGMRYKSGNKRPAALGVTNVEVTEVAQ